MNLGTERASVQVCVTIGGQVTLCPKTPLSIEPGAAANFYPPVVAELPPGMYGTAFMDSNQPIAVVAVDASLTSSMDTSVYRGIGVDAPPTPPAGQPTAAPQSQFAPLMLMEADLHGPERPTPDASVSLPAQPPHAAVTLYLPVGNASGR
jgi:hypothetical protein